MEDVFVGRLLSSPVHTVDPGTPVQDAARTMVDEDIGSLLVVVDGDLVGIVTATDFVRAAAEGDATADAEVGDYMTDDVVTTTANETIRDVADTMIEHGFHHVPVVEDGAPIGMLTTSDLTAYISHFEKPRKPA